jgi:hypothetical protein
LELDNEGNLQICVRPLVVEYRPSDTDIDQTETLKYVEDERTEYSKSFKCDHFVITCIMSKYYNNSLTGVMVFNATVNNISVTSWRSVLLVEETGVPGENHRTKCT